MIDTPEDFAKWPFLRHILGECRDVLIQTYVEANKKSGDAQKWHLHWVKAAAASATVAVLLAIVQLSGKHSPLIRVSELLAIGAAIISFYIGNRTRKTWLLERHKAERCRFLKFGSLILPELYEQETQLRESCIGQLGRHVNSVKNLSYADLENWMFAALPSPPGRISLGSLQEVRQLRDYYRAKRLDFQSDYFYRQARRSVRSDTFWRKILPRLFIASVLCVFFHALSELHEVRWVQKLGWWTLLGAALLPVLSSGIRTWRSAREATRNMSRFRAKYLALNDLSSKFAEIEIKNNAEVEIVVRDLWYAEQIMESEHREWLQLMMEAEWMA